MKKTNISRETSALRRLGVVVLLLAAASSAWGQASVTGINQVSSTRVGRTTFNYTYTINVTNGSPGLSNAVATVTSSASATTIVQGSVALGTLAAGASVTSTNTFTLQQDRTVAFNPASLTWTVTGTPFDVVPNVVGLTQAAATSAITSAGLVVGTVTTASSSTVPSGSVISQSPLAGASAAPGSAVNLTVSTGPAPVTVPNVVGLSQSAATTAITGAGLTVGTVTTASSSSAPSGNVISESPVGGASVAAGSAVNLTVSSGPAPVAVPNVVGLTQAAAASAITGAGLVVGTVTTASSSTVPSGSVISQSPSAGASAASGSAVNLTVSSGPAPVAVPNVVGLTQAAATSAITGASLVVGTVTTASSSTVPSGSVISQSPSAGASAASGSAVNLTVSSGPAQVTVPNVVGLTQAAATSAITGASLTLGAVTTASSSTVPSGSVISQSPSGGASAASGSAVNLTVSSGPAQVTVPNVVGLTQAAATSAITGANLTLGTVTTASSSTVPSGSVIGQSPSAGASAATGSAVNLVVSTGPAQVTVPNVVGLTQAAATAAITGANLTLGTVTTASSSTVPSGSVISQSPSAGASAGSGSAVNLTVSTGPALVAVPNVVGSPQAAATSAITGAGLVVGTVTTVSSSTVPSGDVISEAPIANTQEPLGFAVSLVVSSGPSTAAQVLLPGDPNSLAVSATYEVPPVPVDPSLIASDGTVLDTIDLTFASDATVAQVNNAIQSVSGSILSMEAGVHRLSVQIAPAATGDALSQTATALSGLPGILDARPGIVPHFESWPETPTVAAAPVLQHLAAIRSLAAFNAANKLSTDIYPCECAMQSPTSQNTCPTVFIPDSFDTTSSAPPDFLDRVPGIFQVQGLPILSAGIYDSNNNLISYSTSDPHGNFIAMVLGARYVPDNDPFNLLLGANPLSYAATQGSCVNLAAVQMGNTRDYEDMQHRLSVAIKNYVQSYPSNSVIVSSSIGYPDKCLGTTPDPVTNQLPEIDCSNDDSATQLRLVPSAFDRAVDAMTWRWRTGQVALNGMPYWQHELIFQAAGNEADANSETHWPGVGYASNVWWLSLAAATTPLDTIMVDPSFWPPALQPATPPGTYPYIVLQGTAAQVAAVVGEEAKEGQGTANANTIYVGSVQPLLPTPASQIPSLPSWLATRQPSAFSNILAPTDPGIFAIGEQVTESCTPIGAAQETCVLGTGTSVSTPQVAGTAALLWSIDARIIAAHASWMLTPLYQSAPSVTANLLFSTAVPGVAPETAPTLDALAALLSLDQAVPVTESSAPVRYAMLDMNADGVFDVNDVAAFVNYYFAIPANNSMLQANPIMISAMQPGAPDYMQWDLNGDGFSGVFSRTRFDLDPTGSTQRGAPVLGAATATLNPGSGQIVTFDENQVTDLDVMCYYVYSPLFAGQSDAGGLVRDYLQCGVQELATTGGSIPNGLTGPFTSFDTKVSINDSGEVAFSGSDASGQSAGYVAQSVPIASFPASVAADSVPALNYALQPVTYIGSSTRTIEGGSISSPDKTATPSALPLAAFFDRVSGSPPTYYARSWLTDGSASNTVVGVGNSGNTSQRYCVSGYNAGLECTSQTACPIYGTVEPIVQVGTAACVAPPSGGYTSSNSYLDINDGGLVAFSVLDNNFNFQLWAGHSLSDLAPLTNYASSPSWILRPQVDDLNEVIYSDVSGNIQVSLFPSGSTTPVSTACSQQSQRPGISRDGNFAAFAATCGTQSGIWIAAKAGSGAGAGWTILGPVALVGVPVSVTAEYASAPVFSLFNLTTRVGIASIPRADGSYSLEVVFGGTGSSTVPTAALDGVYKVSATVNSALTTLTVPLAPRKIISLQDTLYQKNVTQYDLWDPISPNGEWVAMWLTFNDQSQAIVRALSP